MATQVTKYSINIAFAVLMTWFARMSYSTVVRVPESGKLKDLFVSQCEQVAPVYLISLLIITGVNSILDRKINGRMSCAFLVWTSVHLVIMAAALLYFSVGYFQSVMQN